MNFYDNLESYGEAVALVAEDGKVLTYASLADATDMFSSHLSGRAVVFILASNNVASVVGYLGCLRSKAPVALLAANLHIDLLTSLLVTYRPSYIWMPRDKARELSDTKELFALDNYVLLAGSQNELCAHEDIALLMTTSGSTGSSKFVRLSYGNITANAASIAEYLEIRADDRAITALPMHYVYGLSIINSHLHVGASVLLTDSSLMEKRFWEQFSLQRVTSLSGVPYTFDLLKRLRWTRMDLPHLRVLTQAGGKLSAELVKEFAGQCMQKGIRFYVMYGAAEATARMSYLLPSKALEKPASIGGPISGGRFWIQDEMGNTILQSNIVGELFYSGPNVSMGYAQNRLDLTLGDVRGQILQTGDMAMRDDDGFYYIVGRKSRFIKLFGNRVSLDEIEQLIRQSGIDCACAGNDEKLVIYITDTAQQKDVVNVAQRLTQLHPSAFRAVVIENIPRNEAGKILYAELPGDL
jgi:acyl-CoA synthetase (AMP-forming)/AMP-acid ligase II